MVADASGSAELTLVSLSINEQPVIKLTTKKPWLNCDLNLRTFAFDMMTLFIVFSLLYTETVY